jgi:hypothetical protein
VIELSSDLKLTTLIDKTLANHFARDLGLDPGWQRQTRMRHAPRGTSVSEASSQGGRSGRDASRAQGGGGHRAA